jgi:hypothetical protein
MPLISFPEQFRYGVALAIIHCRSQPMQLFLVWLSEDIVHKKSNLLITEELKKGIVAALITVSEETLAAVARHF